jgi:hypothetical protein
MTLRDAQAGEPFATTVLRRNGMETPRGLHNGVLRSARPTSRLDPEDVLPRRFTPGENDRAEILWGPVQERKRRLAPESAGSEAQHPAPSPVASVRLQPPRRRFDFCLIY